jgi:hypothetical protein
MSFCVEDNEPPRNPQQGTTNLVPRPDEVPQGSPPPVDNWTPAQRTYCHHPGLHRGWEDAYANTIEGNWLDITDVAPGDTFTTGATQQSCVNTTRRWAGRASRSRAAGRQAPLSRARAAHRRAAPRDRAVLAPARPAVSPPRAGDQRQRSQRRSAQAFVTSLHDADDRQILPEVRPWRSTNPI